MLRDSLTNPGTEALVDFLREHLRAGDCLIQVAGEMEVTYVGRAASTADAGDYLVMLKCDGSLQVHSSSGVKPVNWQPRTDEIMVHEDDGRAVLVAERFKPDEMVRIVFLEPALAMAMTLRDLSGFQLHGSEAQLQAALARHPELIEPGLTVLERELLVGVGGVDLYARDEAGRYVVVELKRGKCTQEAVHQLERYVQAVRGQVPGEVRGILAGASITAPARKQLERSGLHFVEVTSLPIEAAEPDQQPLF